MPRTFVVPHWVKVVFFWFSVSLFGGLSAFQVFKRWRYKELWALTVMEPVAVEVNVPIEAPLTDVFVGSATSMKGLLGKPFLLHFWATWCVPCREEMPKIEQLGRILGERLPIVAVAVDEQPEEVRRFFMNQVPSFFVVLDKQQALVELLKVSKYPETFLIDADGQAVLRFSGQREWASPEAVEYLEGMLGQPRFLRRRM